MNPNFSIRLKNYTTSFSQLTLKNSILVTTLLGGLVKLNLLELSKKYDCLLEMGGNDQWGNIVAGIDLIRRVESKEAADWKQNMPKIRVSSAEISEGITALDIFMKLELFDFKGEARRLIKQGGGYINEEKQQSKVSSHYSYIQRKREC